MPPVRHPRDPGGRPLVRLFDLPPEDRQDRQPGAKVITLRSRLGGRPVTVLAPELDEDPAAWLDQLQAAFPAGVPQLVGLDVESRYMDGPGPWAADWECRTIQLSPDDDTAWVLRCDDLDQMIAAQAVLGDDAKEFTCHTQTDPHAVLVALGVDVMGR